MSIFEPWNLVFVVGFAVYLTIRGRFASRTKKNEATDCRIGFLEKALLTAVIVTSLLFPVIYLFTPLFSFADYELPELAHWCGLALMVTGLSLFWRSHADLALNWSASLELRKGHEVIRDGVYRRIRHPMYAAIWLFSIAQGLLLNNWLAGWAVVVAFACMYFARVPIEEQMMLDQFGQQYQEYMERSGRIIPMSRRPQE